MKKSVVPFNRFINGPVYETVDALALGFGMITDLFFLPFWNCYGDPVIVFLDILMNMPLLLLGNCHLHHPYK